MAASHGSNADVIGNGYVLSQYFNSASFSGSRDSSESTTFKNKSKTYVPGLKDSTLSLEGIWEGDVDQIDPILWAALSADDSGLFTYVPNGQEVEGNRAYSIDSIESSYEISTDVGDVAQISAELQAGDRGRFTRGRIAQSLTVRGSAGNTTGFDGTASSSNGGSLVVHTTASTALSVFLQDSADNSTFADLAGSLTFTTGRASKRLIVSGTIRRYTRVRWTGAGTFLAVVERF